MPGTRCSSLLPMSLMLCLAGCPNDPAPPVAPPATPPPAQADPAAGPQLPHGARVQLDLTDATITDVARELARATGDPVVIDSGAEELASCARLSLVTPEPRDAQQIVALVGQALEGSGLSLERSAEGAIIRRREGVEPPPACRPDAPGSSTAAGGRAGDGNHRPEGIASGIRRVNAATYLVTTGARDAFLSDPSGLSGTMRIVPDVHDGQPRGLRLFGIRSHTAVAQLGLQNGDTVLSVSGYDLSSPEQALEAYSHLRGRSSLEVHLERNGAPVTLTYRIVDRLPDR